MDDMIKKICERLTPTKDSRERMLANILENMCAEDTPLKKKNFIKQPRFLFACMGMCVLCILGTGFVVNHRAKTMNTPVYALTVSNNCVSIKKSSNVVENSNAIEFRDSENVKLSSSDKGYTIALNGGSANGQVVNLFFDIVSESHKRIVVDSNGDFSNLDMTVNCRLIHNNHFEKVPIFEWFMLEDTDTDDNKIQFGLSLWNDVGADAIDIRISNLSVESSGDLIHSGQTVKGDWNLTVSLRGETKKLQEEEQVFTLNQEIDYQGNKILLRSITYSPDTLVIELEDARGSLNQKPFVDAVISIETNQKQIYPNYGSGSGDGTKRSLLYQLNKSISPESINALVIDEIKVPLSRKTES